MTQKTEHPEYSFEIRIQSAALGISFSEAVEMVVAKFGQDPLCSESNYIFCVGFVSNGIASELAAQAIEGILSIFGPIDLELVWEYHEEVSIANVA